MADLATLLQQSAARHSHLCPRQVLGVRAGLLGLNTLGLEPAYHHKGLLVIAETDGCFVDGLEVAAGVSVGHRTLRIEDYGKIAATFVNAHTGTAVRIAPSVDARQRAEAYASNEKRRYFAQLQAYQAMPVADLFFIQAVELVVPVKAIISQVGCRTQCSICHEEIINEREICRGDKILCRACAGAAYYKRLAEAEFICQK